MPPGHPPADTLHRSLVQRTQTPAVYSTLLTTIPLVSMSSHRTLQESLDKGEWLPEHDFGIQHPPWVNTYSAYAVAIHATLIGEQRDVISIIVKASGGLLCEYDNKLRISCIIVVVGPGVPSLPGVPDDRLYTFERFTVDAHLLTCTLSLITVPSRSWLPTLPRVCCYCSGDDQRLPSPEGAAEDSGGEEDEDGSRFRRTLPADGWIRAPPTECRPLRRSATCGCRQRGAHSALHQPPRRMARGSICRCCCVWRWWSCVSFAYSPR
jgi:hypothetical protein